MRRFRLFQLVFAAFAAVLAVTLAGTPAKAQTWRLDEPGGRVASARICPAGEEGSDDFLCFRLECSALEPLHFALDVAGRDETADQLAVTVGVDGGDVGVLTFAPHEATGYTRYTSSYDPNAHDEMIDLLQRGLRASLRLDWPDGAEDVAMGLTGSADALYTVMQVCPAPTPPLPPVSNPGSLVLGEVVVACGELGGTVAMEPGFERREDLDGDGREDLVIDYAAAACSEAATLNCGSGGCTVGFFLARDDGYTRMFADVIRGYEVFPGGFLALDLHGTACGLYGFEACRKVFDVAGDAPVLVEEIAGPDAETMTVASVEDAPEVAAAAGTGDEVVLLTDGAPVAPEVEAGEAPLEIATAEAPVEEAPVVAVPVEEALVEDAPTEAAPAADAPAVSTAETAPETPQAPAATEADDAPEEVALAVVTPEATPTTEAVAAQTAAVTPAAAGSSDEEDGPRSRHDAGPAPAIPETATFRGDGTLIVPEEALQ